MVGLRRLKDIYVYPWGSEDPGPGMLNGTHPPTLRDLCSFIELVFVAVGPLRDGGGD